MTKWISPVSTDPSALATRQVTSEILADEVPALIAQEITSNPPLVRHPMVHLPATTGANMNINGIPAFDAATREDSGWAHTGATITYTGTPDRVYLNINLHGVLSDATSGARVAPVLELSRGGTLIDVAATGYIRDTNDHEESTLSITLTDPTPGVDPSYSLVLRRDSTISATLPVSIGYLQAEAVL